jgi:hypothetical protein
MNRLKTSFTAYPPRPRDVAAPQSIGRNGNINTTGVRLFRLQSEVLLNPVTSRGMASMACCVALPAHAGTLRELSASLLEMAAHIDANPNPIREENP